MEPIFNKDSMNYQEFKGAQYPGYTVKGVREIKAQIADLEAKGSEIREIYNRTSAKYGEDNSITKEVGSRLVKVLDQIEALNKAMTTGSAFTDQSITDLPYTPAEVGFSFANLAGRQVIDANRVRVVMDQYDNTATAEIVAEGGSATRVSLTDSLTILETDSDETLIFDDTQEITEGVYEDDHAVISSAFDSAHAQAMNNAENKKALEILIASKSAIAVSAENVQEAINANLSGKGKANAVIVTNHSGFAELDIDVSGVALVTRDPDGSLVYKHKYKIEEIPDEILPDNEDGSSPILIGDFAHALKFYTIRDDSLVKEDIFPATIADRKIRKEIITLSTKSDKAYIIGYLA